MARNRIIRASAINIRVHTRHDPLEYEVLWKLLYGLKRPTVRGTSGFMIGDVRKVVGRHGQVRFAGHIYRFTNIDGTAPWFDINNHEEATEEDLARINIPENLRPNLAEVPYIFDTESHRLYFKSGGYGDSISPSLAMRMLKNLFGASKVVNRFGDVDATILVHSGALDSLLKWPEIRRIEVTIERPNPAEFDDEASYYEKLRARGLQREEVVYVKDRAARTIAPDDEMRRLFSIASNNGKYSQVGINMNGISDRASISNYPRIEAAEYDSDVQLEFEAFEALTEKIGK